MGKRELLIVLVLVVLGGALYQVTAPPAAKDRGFSFGRLLDEIRADIRSDATSSKFTHSATIAVAEALEEVRLSGVTGRITVTGEDRTDIAYALEVSSTGPDEATATEYAKRTVLVEDDLGDTLGLRVSYPPEARQTTALEVRVPHRLRLRIEGGNSGEFKDFRVLRLEGVLGEVDAQNITEEVSGSHRNGRLTLADVGAVTLTLQSSRALLTDISGPIVLNATRGETRIVDSTGTVRVEQSNNELRLEQPRGAVEVSGSGGEVDVIDPLGELRIDVRRTEVTLTVSHAVPMTVITSDEPLRLFLDGPPSVVVDAVVAGSGDVVADEFGLTPTTAQDETSLTHAFGTEPTIRISLRNRRDDIVIRKRK